MLVVSPSFGLSMQKNFERSSGGRMDLISDLLEQRQDAMFGFFDWGFDFGFCHSFNSVCYSIPSPKVTF